MIPPGGEGKIKAKLRTAGRSGRVKKSILVTSNDPKNPRLRLTLEGEVLVDVRAEPRHLNLGQIAKGAESEVDLALIVTEPEKVEIDQVSIEDERFEIRGTGSPTAGRSEYEVKFAGSDEIGRVATYVVVKYSGSDVDEVKVPIRANVVGDLHYTRSMYFNKREDGFPERTATFSSRSGKKVVIKKVEDPAGKLEVELSRGRDPKQAVITARIKDDDERYPRPERHELKVHTNDPDQPVVELRYTISERGRLRRGRGSVSGAAAQPRRLVPPRPDAKRKHATEENEKKTAGAHPE